jgi:hypothetical protein
MKKIAIIVALLPILLANLATAGLPDRVEAYLRGLGVDALALYKSGAIVFVQPSEGADVVITRWVVEGIEKPSLDQLPSDEDAIAANEAVRQASKSALHKAADNAMITVLIRGGFVPEGTAKLSPGTEQAVTIQLLQAEVTDPTNATIQAISTKLDRLKTIIKSCGGTADDAIVHQ